MVDSDSETNSWTPPHFIYWKFASRAQAPMLMLHAANVPYVWDDATANAWPEPKNTQPFGQLPVLVHGGEDRWDGWWQSFDRRVAQSGTITRYCARLAGLWPKETNKWLILYHQIYLK